MTKDNSPLPLYGLSLEEGQKINVGPYAWKTEVDLSTLGVPYELQGKTFAQIRGEFEKETGNPKVSVPTIKAGDEWVTDSWTIAEWLDKKYGTPERSLFAGGEALNRFINTWVDSALFGALVPLFAPWLYQAQNAESSQWFLKQKLGGDKSKIDALIAASKDPKWVDDTAAAARGTLQTLEKHLAAQQKAGKGPFIAGTDYPTHADADVFGWYGASAAVRPYDVLEKVWHHEELPLVSEWAKNVIKVSGVKAPKYDYQAEQVEIMNFMTFERIASLV